MIFPFSIFSDNDKLLSSRDEKIISTINRYCYDTYSTEKSFLQIIKEINSWPDNKKYGIFFQIFIYGHFDGGSWFCYVDNICKSGNSAFFDWLEATQFDDEKEKAKQKLLLQLYCYDYLGDAKNAGL